MIKEHETYYRATKDEMVDLMRGEIYQAARQAAKDALAEHLTQYRLYNKQQAAKQLGVSPATITKWCARGKIKTCDGFISGFEIVRILQQEITN